MLKRRVVSYRHNVQFITQHSCRGCDSCHFLLNSLATFVIVHDCLRNDLNTHLLFNKCSPITRIHCSCNVRCVKLESDFHNHSLIIFFNYFANNNLSHWQITDRKVSYSDESEIRCRTNNMR